MPIIETLTVSLVFIALSAGSLFLFGGWIGASRSKTGIIRGTGDDATLFKRSRIHGNFVENAPLFALVLLAAESIGTPTSWLWLAVASFFIGRIQHCIRYDKSDRAVGAIMSTGPAFLLALYILWTIATG